MKILYIVHKFLPRYFSGTEIYTCSLAKEMQRRGHTVQVFCAENVDDGRDGRIRSLEDIYDGIPVHRINFNRRKTPDVIRYAYHNPLVAADLMPVLRTFQPDLVHVMSFINVSAAVMDAVQSFSCPIVFTATDYWCFCPRSTLLNYDLTLCTRAEASKCLACIISISPFYHKALRKLGLSPIAVARLLSGVSTVPGLKENAFLKGATALQDRPRYLRQRLEGVEVIIAPNAFMRELFLDMGVPPWKVILSGYGLNTEGIAQAPGEAPLRSIRFGYMGMLGQLKGVDLLIRAFSALGRHDRTSLAVYGDASHFPDYVRFLRDLAAPYPAISFKGTFPPDRLGAVLGEIDVLAVPSLWYENAPLVIQSAFAAGVPVIASDVPGISALVTDGANGLLFSRGDKQALQRCLMRFLEDPGLVLQLRKNIQPVKTIIENGAELEVLYCKLIAGGNTKRQKEKAAAPV